MKSNKKFLALAVAGALTAATAVPALALENEFHGTFTSFYDLSNYSAVGNDSFEPATMNATGLQKDAKTENYFVQRARIAYTAKVNDNIKLATKFELDYTFWGNSSYTTGRNSGGGLGADSVQIETKNVFLDLDYPKLVHATIGMQPYNDTFKGILFDADMAGVLLAHDYSKASVSAGFFRFGDRSPALGSGNDLGRNTNDMISLDSKFNITKDVRVGASYYYINDNRKNTPAPDSSVKVHTVGLNAEGVVGPVTLNGFAVKQFGDLSETQDAKGYALNVGAKVGVLGGTARSEFLYVSGGSHAFFVPTSPAGSEGAALYDAELIMLHRDKNAKTIDTAIVYDVNNFNQGLILGSVGFDYPFSSKFSASANAGFAAAAKNNGSVATGTSDYYGTELNLEANYKVTPNLTFGVRGGYVFLGDYFKGLNADNPYDMKILANLAF